MAGLAKLGLLLLSVALLGDVRVEGANCRESDLSRCIALAQPLLQDQYVFPHNTDDINHICTILFPQTWSKFVDCIGEYTETCLNQQQRTEFNRAVGDSINSVHKLCTNQDYQSSYLEHATCLKERATQDEYCGSHYSRLVSLVTGEATPQHQELCCTHTSFKECVIAETETCPCPGPVCASDSPESFAKAMLEKALGFVLKQCDSYRPNSADCPLYQRKQVKLPRIEEDAVPEETRYEAYFPSGPPQRDLRKDDILPLEPPQQDLADELLPREEEEIDVVQDIDMTDLIGNSNVMQQTTFSPQEPVVQQQPKENERRQPWIPPADMSTFDDIFNNAVENTRAAELSSGGGAKLTSLLPFVAILIVNIFM